MRFVSILPLALVATAYVVPDAQMAQALNLQPEQPSHPFWDSIKDKSPERIWEELEQKFDDAAHTARHGFDEAVGKAYDMTESTYESAMQWGEATAFAGKAWLESVENNFDLTEDGPPEHGPPHHGPPHHGPPPPGHGPPDHDHPPHHKPPHHGPPHHRGPPEKTVYELIASSNYTTILAKAINQFPDLVKLLNGTTANFTVFAPTDRAFEKIPEHARKPPKEILKKILTYHVSPEFYPAGRVLVTRTIPTALEAPFIHKEPQRLSTQIGLRGLTVNFYSRVIAVNIFGTNGVIHGVDSILLPPPKAVRIISALPGTFSTLELALLKTGLYESFNDTSLHNGGTLFAPSNFAFKLLGPRINAFLFSSYGTKYLKALILYHASPTATLYSDAIYKNSEDHKDSIHKCDSRIPRGLYHIELETGLKGKSLSVDIGRYGRLITIKINGFSRVSVSDGIAADGVIHTLSNVLIPPKEPGSSGIITEDMSVDELKARLAPFVQEDFEDQGYGSEEIEL